MTGADIAYSEGLRALEGQEKQLADIRARMATRGGRLVLKRRRAKGRARLTV